jgi:hypothetical protein
MSYIYGHIPRTADSKGLTAAATSRLSCISSHISIFGDGPQETFCHGEGTTADEWSWAVCGIGISRTPALLTREDWNSLLQRSHFDRSSLDGHWVAVRWKKNSIEFYGDPMELRRLYWSENNSGVVFSTDLERLVDMMGSPKFSFENYAGHWMHINSFGNTTLLQGVSRLGPFGRMTVHNGKITRSEEPWAIPENPPPFSLNTLEKLVNLPAQSGKKVALSLSGGIDCRTILALSKTPPELVTFGTQTDPDVQLALRAGKLLGTRTRFFEQRLPHTANEKEQTLNKMKGLSLSFEAGFNLSQFTVIDFLETLRDEKYWLIDGGLGEVMRQAYGVRLLHQGKKLWNRKEYSGLARFFRAHRTPLFSKSIMSTISHAADTEIIQALKALPNTVSFETWIELLHLRYRVKNAPPNSQAGVDTILPKLMPCIQPSFIRSLHSLSNTERRGNALNRKIIKAHRPQLAQIPLAWYNTTVPFSLSGNTAAAKLYSVIAGKLRKKNTLFRNSLLYSLREPLMDRLNSRKVRECAWYDTAHLHRLRASLASDSIHDASPFYEWLAVDFWRERITK